MNKIEGKIVGYQVKTKLEPQLTKLKEGINENTKRENTLSGRTYKIKPSTGEDSYYITINNQVVEGKQHPIEIFINSKNVAHFQWVTVITRMLSAVFRKGGDVHFLVEELSAIYDPIGGYWGKDRVTGKGKQYKSIIHELGDVIEEHLDYTTSINKLVPE